LAISTSRHDVNDHVLHDQDDDDDVHDDDGGRHLHHVDVYYHRHESLAAAVVTGKDQRDSPAKGSDLDPAPIVSTDQWLSDTVTQHQQSSMYYCHY